MPRPSLCARAQFYCTYVVCTLCITTDIRIITVYKDNSSQIKSSKTAAFAKPAIREKLIGGGAWYVGAGLTAAALLAAPRLVICAGIPGHEFLFYVHANMLTICCSSQTMPSGD